MSFDLLGIGKAYRTWQSAAEKLESLKAKPSKAHKARQQADEAKRAFLRLTLRLAGGGAIVAAIGGIPLGGYLLTSAASGPEAPTSATFPSEMMRLEQFFQKKSAFLLNEPNPAQSSPATFARLAFAAGWTIEQLQSASNQAQTSFANKPFVQPTLHYRINDKLYAPFIATGVSDNIGGQSVVHLIINHPPAVFSDQEWADMFSHEINHARFQHLELIAEKAYASRRFDPLAYNQGYYYLILSQLAPSERPHFVSLCNSFIAKLVNNVKRDPDDAQFVLGGTLNEALADLLIDPVSETTGSRYQKMVNRIIKSNNALDAEWVSRVETVGQLYGTTINSQEATQKIVGDPSLKEVTKSIIEVVFSIRTRLIGHFQYDQSRGLFIIRP